MISNIVNFYVHPIIENNHTLVPFRGIFEALDATVDWEAETRKVMAQLGDTTIELTIDSSTAYVNGESIELDIPPRIVNERTLVPLRFIAENFGFDVFWDEHAWAILIEPITRR
jgi:hypothetical protein